MRRYVVTLKILHIQRIQKIMYHKVRVELLNEKRETEISKS